MHADYIANPLYGNNPCYCQEFLTKLDNLHKGVNR